MDGITEWYLRHFYELCSDRPQAFGGVPAIPRHLIRDYGRIDLGLDGFDLQLFLAVIRGTDRKFVELNAAEQKAKDSAMKAKSKNNSVSAKRKATLKKAGH